MSCAVFLSVIFVQGVCGTFFPPVSNPPPIPGQAVRILDTQSQKYLVQEDLPQELRQQTIVKDGLYPGDANLEQRWYIQENQSGDSRAVQSSVETFDRFYPNGEPAIGPVATPMPDDAYVAQSSSISNLNPNDPGDIWVLTRGPDGQYAPESRWVQIQVPSERLVEVVNQETGPPLVADSAKTAVVPVPPEVPVKSQFLPDTPASVVQQVWVRSPDVVSPQTTALALDVPPVKQVIEVAPPSAKQVVQQQIVTKDALYVPPPVPLPPAPAVISKTQFTVPPPLPPPLKGGDPSPKVISPLTGNIVPNKNGLVQQIRHIWIPTSPSTGKFISVPVSPVADSGKKVPSKGIPQNVAPISVSDTWVLKQDGPIPSFEKLKSAVPPPIIQSGKVIVQDPPVLQVNTIPAPPIIAQVDTPQNVPIVSKSVDTNVPLDLWPPRKDIANPKGFGKSPVVLTAQLPPPPPPNTVKAVLTQSLPVPPPINQKTLFSSPKIGPFSLPPPATAVQIVNGKPCPVPPHVPQKSLIPPTNPSVIALPRLLATRKQPLTRIIRVNRYPTGSYYLLNTGVRPNIFTYPNPAYIRQSGPRLVRLVQAKQTPIQIQGRPVIPVQTKQISIPVQSKLPDPVPARQVLFPFSGRQIVLPVSNAKNPGRIIYPAVQAVRLAYPWNAALKPNPVPGLRVLAPQLSPLKKSTSKKKASKSASSSSESSSDSSSESDTEEKKEEKREKLDEKPQNEEESSESSRERESESGKESESKSVESKSEENSKSDSQSIETAESQFFQTQENVAVLPKDGEDPVKTTNKPSRFRFDRRNGNGTAQNRQEVSDSEGRGTGTYGYLDPEMMYRVAQYISDRDGFRINLESNEPGTASHSSAHANFITNQMAATEEKSIFETGDSTERSTTTEFQRD